MEKICEICGKRYMAVQKNQVVCSLECHKERARRKSREKYREEHPVIMKKCPACGKAFDIRENNSHNKKYCSIECRRKASNHTEKGAKTDLAKKMQERDQRYLEAARNKEYDPIPESDIWYRPPEKVEKPIKPPRIKCNIDRLPTPRFKPTKDVRLAKEGA